MPGRKWRHCHRVNLWKEPGLQTTWETAREHSGMQLLISLRWAEIQRQFIGDFSSSSVFWDHAGSWNLDTSEKDHSI